MGGEAAEPQQFPVSTPARRPETAHLNANTPIEASEPAWTSSRCHRLLRPLTSRIAALRKRAPTGTNSRERANQEAAPSSNDHNRELPTPLPILNPPPRRGSKKGAIDDPDWSPASRPVRRVRHTYRSKGATASRRAAQESLREKETQSTGAIDPLSVLRECKAEPSHPSDTEPFERPRKRQRISHERFRNVARATSASNWTIYLQLYKALECLLQFTKRRNRSPNGVDSMFNLCLKAVPAYISEEQAHVLDEDPDSQDQVSTAVYADLESWGSTNGNGWRPFRILVRSHAIAVLCDAITHGTLPCRVAIELADLCFSSDAIEEGHRLCDALLSRMDPLPLPSEPSTQLFNNVTNPELTAVHNLAISRSLWGYFFARMAELLRNRVLPVEWLSSKDMGNIWNRAILSITKGDSDSQQAIDFLQVSIELLCGNAGPLSDNDVPRDGGKAHINQPNLKRLEPALTRTLLNILALLLAIGELSSSEDHWRIIHGTVSGFAVRAVASLEAATSSVPRLSSQMRWRRSLVLLTYILLPALTSNDSIHSPLTLERAVEELSTLSTGQDSAERFSDLIQSTALCCGKVDSDASWICIQRMVAFVHRLAEELALESSTAIIASLQKLLNRAGTLAAVDYAETTEVSTHLNWAYELEHLSTEAERSANRRCRCVGRSCAACGQDSFGFRWEEGIDEWVQKTPGLKKGQQLIQRAKTAPESSDFFDESSSPLLPTRQTGTLASFTDTPLPSVAPESGNANRSTLLDLTATPAPLSRRQIVHANLDENTEESKIGHLFDLSADFDDIDELSILTDRSPNQNRGNAAKKNPGRVRFTPHAQIRKRLPLEQRYSTVFGLTAASKRGNSLDFANKNRTKPIEERCMGLKRNFGDRQSLDDYSSSGDELAF